MALTVLLLVLNFLRLRPPHTAPSSTVHRIVRSRWWPTLTLAVVASTVLAAVIYVETRGTKCTFDNGDRGVVAPSPAEVNDLTFCPVEINHAKPIRGRFNLAGQVDGPISERENSPW